jgi:hypothetical protein
MIASAGFASVNAMTTTRMHRSPKALGAPARSRSAPTRSSTPSRSVVWARFFEVLAEHLQLAGLADSPPLIADRRRRVLAWRRRERLERVELVSWSRPEAGRTRAPSITRIAGNHFAFDVSQALVRRLGFRPTSPWSRPRPRSTPELDFEWTALDDELEPLARWLPSWMQAKLDPTLGIALPPVPSHVFGRNLHTSVYAWTKAAWEAWTKYDAGKIAPLPWYAIPADKLVAEPGEPGLGRYC